MNAKPQRRSLLLRLLVAAIAIIVAVLAWRHFSAAQPAAGTTPGAHQAAGKTGAGRAAGGRRGAPMSPVQAATATRQTVPRYLSGLGTATAANTVTVTSRVDGQLMAIHFTEGQQVKAGDLLAEIDPRPFQVQLTQAQGQLAKDQATLANARRDLARYQQLVKTNLVSRQELDTQASLVQQTEGAIKADQGAVDSAKLQITYSRITAPIDGRVGLKLVDVGNYVTSGSTTGLVVITQTHPIDVVFTLPEGNIADLLKAQKAGPVGVEAWDRTNQNKLTTGSLLSLDNQIDTATGTIKLKARFTNEDDALFPQPVRQRAAAGGYPARCGGDPDRRVADGQRGQLRLDARRRQQGQQTSGHRRRAGQPAGGDQRRPQRRRSGGDRRYRSPDRRHAGGSARAERSAGGGQRQART